MCVRAFMLACVCLSHLLGVRSAVSAGWQGAVMVEDGARQVVYQLALQGVFNQ